MSDPAPRSPRAAERFDTRSHLLPSHFIAREVHGLRVQYGTRMPGPGGRGFVHRIELDAVPLLIVLTFVVSIPPSRRPGYGRRGGRVWRASVRAVDGRPIWNGTGDADDSILPVLYRAGLLPHPEAPAVMVDAWRAEWPNERARILGDARPCDFCWNHLAAAQLAACPSCQRSVCPACRPTGKTACRDCGAAARHLALRASHAPAPPVPSSVSPGSCVVEGAHGRRGVTQGAIPG